MVIAHPNPVNDEVVKVNWTEELGLWSNGLKDLLTSNYMDDLVNFIEQQYKSKYGIFPINRTEVFKAFRLCDETELKVVIMGHEPYPGPKSNGLAFGSSLFSSALAPHSQAMLNCVRNTIYNDSKTVTIDPTLHDWATQGVLLLNAALTTEAHTSHDIYWRNFTRTVIKYINDNFKNIVFMFPDSTCNYFKKYIDPKKHKLLEHAGTKLYVDCPIFLDADQFLYTHYKETISW